MQPNSAVAFAEASIAVCAAVANETGEPPTVYITPHLLSQQVAGAFAEGCGGPVVKLPRLADRDYDFSENARDLIGRGFTVTGPIATYGILRGCGELLAVAQMMKHDFWHIDNGYVRASNHDRRDGYGRPDPDLSGYYRITRNGFQNTDEPEDRPSDRWEKCGVKIARTWNKSGKDILLIPPPRFVSLYQNVDPQVWLAQVEAEIKKRTDRPIKIKAHKGGLGDILPQTHCVVTHESMAALHSVIGGVPAIALGRHCLGELAWTWDDLERPRYFGRERVDHLCHWLAYNQYTLDEMRSGKAWEMLNA